MNNLEFMLTLPKIDYIIEIIKVFFVILFTIKVYTKIGNIKNISKFKIICIIIYCILSSIITTETKRKYGYDISLLICISLIMIMNSLVFRKEINYSILATIISYCISHGIYLISTGIAFFPCAIFMIENDFINLIIIIGIYFLLMYSLTKIKKLKYGLTFIQNKLENSSLTYLILNICIIVLFLNAIYDNLSKMILIKSGIVLLIALIYMFISISQSFKLYYKQKQLEKDLMLTKEEVKEKDKKIEELEKDNLEASKKAHSLHHKISALEYKIKQLSNLPTVEKESKDEINRELKDISKQAYKEPKALDLDKTEINSIDTMLEYMKAECEKENIKLELQLNGNIHYMINHLITEEELEVMLADHIKDARIAIKYSENQNRSILVRLGKIDGIYGVYIYDTGIEFTKEVLDKLGKEPITTHKESGGTGMGFMNTFDLLRKYKASLIIEEIGKPSIDNYTKVLMIKFDNMNEYKVKSYK